MPQVRPGYIVDLDEHVYLHELDAHERQLIGRPDNYIAVSKHPSWQFESSTATLAPPLYTRTKVIAIDRERMAFLKILDRRSRELVTVIEILSPANKGSDRADYLDKRQKYLDAGVGLVEIDLLRGGQRIPLEELPPCDYCITVIRPTESPRTGLWPIRLRDPLPTIPVPLRKTDPDATLDLQDLLHRIYDAAGYQDHIYDGDPEPALESEDAAWVMRTIRAISVSD